MSIKDWIIEKLNPAQPEILMDEGETHTTTVNKYTIEKAYEDIEVVQRGSNFLTDSCSAISFDIGNKIRNLGINSSIKKRRLKLLLNYKPNPFQNIDTFKRHIYLDLVLEGNAFIYYDGMHLFHLPANKVTIEGDKKTYIKQFKYNEKPFKVNEIIHIRDNSLKSIYRGDSRIKSALGSIDTLGAMLSFQENFFKNNAVPGLILKTPNILSDKIKDRLLAKWMKDYNPRRGGKKPVILDGDFDVENLGHTDFRELDFAESITIHETKILKAIGIPPILLDAGNNANISPNLRLFYITSALPLVEKVTTAFEFFFGFDLKPNISEVLALQPELKETAAYHTGLVNGGIITPNESREKLRYPKDTDENSDKLRIPANIAGSAGDPTQGGRPNEGDK